MTTYTAIADSEIDPESPGTTTLFTKLRDNPIAITEGASGAPNIQTAAIANSAITAAKINDGAVSLAKLAASSAGTTPVLKFLGTGDNTFSSSDSSYPTGALRGSGVDAHKFSATCIKAGSIRVAFEAADSTGNNSYIRVYKNGSNVFDYNITTNYPTYTSNSTDLSLAVGDEVVIVAYNTSATTIYVRNLQISTNGDDYCVV